MGAVSAPARLRANVLPFPTRPGAPEAQRSAGAVLVDACDALRRTGRLALAADVLEIASELDLGEDELARFDDAAEQLTAALERAPGER